MSVSLFAQYAAVVTAMVTVATVFVLIVSYWLERRSFEKNLFAYAAVSDIVKHGDPIPTVTKDDFDQHVESTIGMRSFEYHPFTVN